MEKKTVDFSLASFSPEALPNLSKQEVNARIFRELASLKSIMSSANIMWETDTPPDLKWNGDQRCSLTSLLMAWLSMSLHSRKMYGDRGSLGFTPLEGVSHVERFPLRRMLRLPLETICMINVMRLSGRCSLTRVSLIKHQPILSKALDRSTLRATHRFPLMVVRMECVISYTRIMLSDIFLPGIKAL